MCGTAHVAMSHEVCGCVSREVLKLDGDIQKLAAGLKDAHNLLLFGRGYNYATALEAALKVRTWRMEHIVLYLGSLVCYVSQPIMLLT